MAGKFEVDDGGLAGVSLAVAVEPLCSYCLSDVEVDWQIASMKADLDATALEMKAAILSGSIMPLFGGKDA